MLEFAGVSPVTTLAQGCIHYDTARFQIVFTVQKYLVSFLSLLLLDEGEQATQGSITDTTRAASDRSVVIFTFSTFLYQFFVFSLTLVCQFAQNRILRTTITTHAREITANQLLRVHKHTELSLKTQPSQPLLALPKHTNPF